MARPPRMCSTDTMYGYNVSDVVQVGGPKGKQGPKGLRGPPGENAYQVALRSGFVGTLEEWLESLRGEDGEDGKDGKDGKDGEDGLDGGINAAMPPTDADILEWDDIRQGWYPTKQTRELYLDGGNF